MHLFLQNNFQRKWNTMLRQILKDDVVVIKEKKKKASKMSLQSWLEYKYSLGTPSSLSGWCLIFLSFHFIPRGHNLREWKGKEREDEGGSGAIKPIYIPHPHVPQRPVVPVPANIVRPLSYLQQSAIHIGLMTCVLYSLCLCLWQACCEDKNNILIENNRFPNHV